ncbi:MAG: PKD domain-containing protein, partial [Janthinobacterium sp.]
ASGAGALASNGYTDVQVEAGIRYGSGYGPRFWTVAGEADYLLNTDVKYHDSTNKLNPSPANKLTVVATIGHNAWSKMYDTLFRPVVNYYGSTGNCQNGCNNGGVTVAPNTNGSSVRGSGITQDSLNVYEWFLTKTRNIPNTPVPTAVAGADQAITLPTNSVTVDGNGSSAGSGATFTAIVWSRLIGPVNYVITNPNSLSTTITGLAAGHYVFRLTVTNSVGISNTDDLVIDVTGNVTYGHPTVTLTSAATQNITTSSATISASYTVGGSTIKSIKWTKLKTPGQATKKIVWIGSSTIVGNGASVFDSAVHNRTVAFATANSLLSTDVNLAVGGTSVYQAMPTGYANTGLQDAPDTSMNITKALSLNPDIIIVGFPSNDYDILTIGEIMAAYRTIHAAAVSAGKVCYLMTTQPRSAFGPAGERMLRDITDSLRASELAQWTIDTHTPVTAYDGVTELYGAGDFVHQNNEGHRMLFNNTVSRNLWTTWATSASAITQSDSLSTTVTGLVDGEHKFLVAITDAHEQTAYAVTTINVTTLGNQAPTANAGLDQSITLPVSSVTLNGSGTDPDGTIASYAWTKISGTGGTITSASSASTEVTGLTQGSYSFRLVVTDNNGATDSDTVNVTVAAAPTGCNGVSYVAAASPDGSTGYFNTHNLQPGDTLILDGTYTYVYVANRNGTSSCPIVIINRNGQAKLRGEELLLR